MPEFGVAVCKRPDYALPAQTADNPRIFVNVLIIVEVDESVSNRLAEDDPDERDQSGRGAPPFFRRLPH
jgi:hypothetical protein